MNTFIALFAILVITLVAWFYICSLFGRIKKEPRSTCEGCGELATCADSEGVPLCDDCYKELELVSEVTMEEDSHLPEPPAPPPAPAPRETLTIDRNHPGLNRTQPNGQQETYLILSEQERAKGFVRPVRRAYKHVGKEQKHPMRDLTAEEKERYKGCKYVKYEAYPPGSNAVGRFWTQSELDRCRCGAVTTMGLALCETYARNPKFYGATFCCSCGAHFPVDEFVWVEDGAKVGS